MGTNRLYHSHLSRYHLLPQAPEGAELRSRSLPSRKPWAVQHDLSSHMMAGGFFSTAAPAGKMRGSDLVKAAALTVDVDFCDQPELLAEWQCDRNEAKARLYAMSQSEVIDLMESLDFLNAAIDAAHTAGLPSEPNRVLFTGHGACFLYWLSDDEGWADAGTGNGWTPTRMKEAVKRWHAGEGSALWWWDSDAKDIGTRIFPLPGECHRERGHDGQFEWGKTIFTLDEGHDTVTPLTPWFETLEAKYPAPQKRSRKAAPKTQKERATTPDDDRPWTTKAWKDEWDGEFALDIDGRGACPLCDTDSGLRRMEANRYACFHCRTQMPKVDRNFSIALDFSSFEPEPDEPVDPNHIQLDDNGRALWPDLVPKHALLKARTGAGKTWLMEREKNRWLSGNSPDSFRGGWVTERRVIAVSPYNSLAAALAERLNTTHATPDSKVNWRSGSCSTTFASLARVLDGMTPATLANTMLLLDESEQMLQQLQGMLDGETARQTYGTLTFGLAHAGRVILADAHASKGTELLIEQVNVVRAEKGLAPITFTTWHTDDHDFEFHAVLPVERTSRSGRVYTVESAHRRHLNAIDAAVTAGKRLAVVYFSKGGAQALGARLAQEHPTKSVRVIVGGRGYKEQHDFSEDSLKHDVLVYNIAMGTGVSFDVPDWYDEVHVLLDKAPTVTGPQVLQALHRIRRPKCHTIFVSGSWSDPITDWRTDPALVLDRSVKRWERGQETAKNWGGIDINGNFHADIATARLTVAQAVNESEAWLNGRGAVLSWLSARYSIRGVDGREGDFAQAVAATRDQQRLDEARAIAVAHPLNEQEAARVDRIGHADEEERLRKDATVYAETFEKAWDDSDEAARTQIAYDAKTRRLIPKARMMAAVRLLLEGRPDVLARAEKRYNSHRTAVTAQTWSRDAAFLVDLFRAINDLPKVDGRTAIDTGYARAAVVACAPRVKFAGRKLNEDWSARPIKQLANWLALVGIKLGVTKRREGRVTVRDYWLSDVAVDKMVRLSDGFVSRWKSKAEEEVSGTRVTGFGQESSVG